jgi:PAS domain S-box-containing protein
LGYGANQVIGKCSPVVFHDQQELRSRAEVLSRELGTTVDPGFDAIAAKARLGGVDQNEWTYLRKDGTRIPVLLGVTALRDQWGILSGYLAIGSDITELKAAQESLRKAEARFRALIQGSNDIVVMLAPSGAILFVSPAVELTIGYRPEEITGGNIFDYVHPDDFPLAREAFQSTLSVPGIAVPLQLRMRGPHGDYHWVEILANNLLNDPDLRAVVLNARDISERRELERRSALQSAVTAVLADAQTLSEAVARILSTVGEQMGYDLGEVWRVDPEAGNLALIEHWHSQSITELSAGEFSVGFRLARGQGLPGAVWQAGDVVIIPDLAKAGAYLRAAKSMKLGLRMGFGVPITSGDEVIAIMDFASGENNVPDESMVRVFRSLGSQIGNFMARKHAEESADSLRRQTQLILESAGEGIIGIDRRYRITFVNPTGERMLGYAPGELAGKDIFLALHPTRADGVPVPQNETPIFSALVEGNQRSLAEGAFWRKDGSSFPAQYIGSPIRGEGGIIGAVITFQDVTRRREVERMKDEFISVVSHELRTPLTSIRGALGLLASGKVGAFQEKGQRMLDIAVNNTDRLVRLINDILDIERIDSGRVTMQKRPVAIGELMQQAVEVMRPMAEKNGVVLEIHPVNATVLVDPDRIMQTLTNLLSNAIKFSQARGTVALGGSVHSDRLHLTVKDQGRGIPEDKLQSIFERFQQVDASDSREKGGTGLGLAICRTIVQQHDGEIWAESKLGEGSTFHIDLPMTEIPPADRGQPDFEGASVLVCDDDAAVREVVGNLLEERGFRVKTVSSGAEAIRSAESDQPDLIVLDLMMPAMNGWQVVDSLRASKATRQIPVVIFSAVRPNGNSQQDQHPVAGWVTKPLEESQFFRTLSQALRNRATKTRVLVVEDDPELSRVMESMLASDGIGVRVARSGRDAIQALPEYAPDLVVLDLILPLGDGFTVVQWMRRSEKFRSLPVMIYSGRELTSDERQKLTVGRTEFFTKGRIAPDDVERHVLTLLAQILPENSAKRG